MKQENGFKPLDDEARRRLEALAAMPDSDIDTSDIKEWTEEDFSQARPFHDIYKPKKEQITTRIDSDILMWLKSHGKGYQTLLNDLLRKEMMEELKASGAN